MKKVLYLLFGLIISYFILAIWVPVLPVDFKRLYMGTYTNVYRISKLLNPFIKACDKQMEISRSNFSVLENSYFSLVRNKDGLFYFDKSLSGCFVKVENVDTESYQKINKYFAKDKNNLYYTKFEDSQFKNIKMTGLNLDKLNVGSLGKYMWNIYDGSSSFLLPEELKYLNDSHYIYDDENILIYHRNYKNGPDELLKVKKEKGIFYPLNNTHGVESFYFINGDHSYFKNIKMKVQIDKESFYSKPGNSDGLYAKDKNNYYYKGEILTGSELTEYLKNNEN